MISKKYSWKVRCVMSKTASYVKDKYNSKTYDRYTFYIRKDEALNGCLQADKQDNPVSQIMKDALYKYYNEPKGNVRPKANKPPPSYKTKRQRRAAMKRILNQLEQIKAAAEKSRDNFPDNLQGSTSYEAAEEYINALEEALEILACFA